MRTNNFSEQDKIIEKDSGVKEHTEDLKKIISIRIKELRKKRNNEDINNKWTQEFVANAIGISRSAYALYETGDNLPSIEVLLKLSELYGGISVDYLLGKQDHPFVDTDDIVNPEYNKFISLLNRLPEDKKEKYIYMLYGVVMKDELD